MSIMMKIFGLISGFISALYRFAELPGIKVLNLSRLMDIWCTLFGSCIRLFTSAWVAEGVKNGTAKRPKLVLKLYEYEACPFCKKVRETASWLDLDLEVYPCPRETLKAYAVVKDGRYRSVVLTEGGKAIFPYLVDPNTNIKMYDSTAIVDYLYTTYGQGSEKPFMYLSAGNSINMLSLFMSGCMRCLPMHGMLRCPSKLPAKPLELWQYEASSYCKIVRERLCSLELPYICHNIARGSTKRADFLSKNGKLQFPFLYDPNTNTKMFDSDKINAYLSKTYQTGNPVNESMSDYSTKGATANHGTLNDMTGKAKKN